MEFFELVKRISSKIRILSSKFSLPSAIDREDLYQECSLHLWERWRKGELEDKTDAYIITSCWFHLKNYIRRFKKMARIVSLNELEDLIPKTPLFDKRVDDILFIQQAKKRLTEREWDVMDLLSQGYTLREIGERLGISHVMVLKIRDSIARKFRSRSC
jgi:RNA polymerase sigma factor (sigma-70 family)